MAVKGDIFDQLASKASEKPDGDIFDKLAADQPSRARSLASAYPKGVLKGAQGLTPFMPRGPIPPEVANKVFDQVLKTQPKDAENFLERAGTLTPIAAQGPEGFGLKAAQLGLGTIAGEIAKENGLGETGQTISELGAMSIPGLAKAGIQKAVPLVKQGVENVSNLVKGPVEKLPSGITKLQAVGAKNPHLGTLSKERQAAVLSKLDKEASDLIKTSTEKNQPITRQIQDGFDFEGKYQKEFGEVQKLAAKANPEINITPVSKLMSETAKKYKGIPSLHPEGAKVLREVNAFRKNPQIGMGNLLKIYRSNNQKVRNIYETSRMTGKQQEYVDFLTDYNRSIADSFKETLPKDSAWLKMFQDSNREYKNYKDAQKTLGQLKDAIGETPNLSKIERLGDDVGKQKRLTLSMGDKGAKEIIQIAKDLKLVKDAIKKIPAKELSKFDYALPLYFFIPLIGKALGIAKTLKLGRYGYGWLLSTPARRQNFAKATKALVNGNLAEYEKAAANIKKDMQDQKLIEFKPSKDKKS